MSCPYGHTPIGSDGRPSQNVGYASNHPIKYCCPTNAIHPSKESDWEAVCTLPRNQWSFAKSGDVRNRNWYPGNKKHFHPHSQNKHCYESNDPYVIGLNTYLGHKIKSSCDRSTYSKECNPVYISCRDFNCGVYRVKQFMKTSETGDNCLNNTDYFSHI